jgi:hypothetical protein
MSNTFQLRAIEKASTPATKKQYNELSNFSNVDLDISISKFCTYLEKDDIEKAIEAAIGGKEVDIWY